MFIFGTRHRLQMVVMVGGMNSGALCWDKGYILLYYIL